MGLGVIFQALPSRTGTHTAPAQQKPLYVDLEVTTRLEQIPDCQEMKCDGLDTPGYRR